MKLSEGLSMEARTAAQLLILAEMLYAEEHPLPMDEEEDEENDD